MMSIEICEERISLNHADDSRLVSVIIPTFNRAAAIGEAVGSVAAQAYRPIELIIVDDGSTDGTGAVIERLCDEHAADEELRMRYIRQQNAGAAAARNQGLRVCRGEYIQFLDSDDLLDSDKLTRQVAMLQDKLEYDVVYGDWLMGADYATGRRLNRSVEADMLAALLRGRWVPCFSYLWRRRAVMRTGLWNEQLCVNDDFDYSVRGAALGATFQYQPGLTGLYRWHRADRLSRQSACNFARANFQVLREVRRALEERGELREDRRRALADCYWSQACHCVNVERDLFHTGMRELRAVCPDWQPSRMRERLVIRRLGAVRAAQLGQGVSGGVSKLRRCVKGLLGDRGRGWMLRNYNSLLARGSAAQ